MRALKFLATAVFTMLASTSPALGHHSFAAQFDTKKPVTLEGTVTKVEWQNPHIWVYVNVPQSDGQIAAWGCEGDNPNSLMRLGWTSQSLTVGEPITIHGFQARSGRHICNGRTWIFGGQTLFAAANDGGPSAESPRDR